MSDSIMLSAQVSEDSALWDGFEQYQERNGFESRSEALRAALRDGIEADRERDSDEPSVTEVRDELRDELQELRQRQETPFEQAGYLLASVVAGTAPLMGVFLTTVTTGTLALLGGVAVAFVGLLIGAVTKIVADNVLRTERGTVASVPLEGTTPTDSNKPTN